MVFVQILLGGITRLTGSGLSITEWKPLIGALPPLNHAEWSQSFKQYQQIAQFKKLNNEFTLSDYQHIFFWEWLHREWARLMALVFIVPFIVFLLQKKFNRQLKRQLPGVFVVGGLQALAGWLMVQSGLNDTDVRVSHIRLAVHFVLALFLVVYLFWMLLSLQDQKACGNAPASFRLLTLCIIMVLGVQLVYGAFMAGTRAALYAPTWPDINGTFFLTTSGIGGSFLHRVVYDPLLIQFIHRSLAYLLFVLLLAWFYYSGKIADRFTSGYVRTYPLMFVIIQVILGILCLLYSTRPVFTWFAVLHQLNAILLLLSVVNVFYHGRKQIVYV